MDLDFEQQVATEVFAIWEHQLIHSPLGHLSVFNSQLSFNFQLSSNVKIKIKIHKNLEMTYKPMLKKS